MAIYIKRIYEAASPADGKRILVDRLWPRGVSHERAALDLWDKMIAPSPDLRTWFGHKPERMAEFANKYRLELATDPEKQQAVAALLQTAKEGDVTLLYAAKDPQINHAAILRDYLVAHSD